MDIETPFWFVAFLFLTVAIIRIIGNYLNLLLKKSSLSSSLGI